MGEKYWLAAYLSYSGQVNCFLSTTVKPFVEMALEEKLADKFHFVRSFGRGPTIRLRFRGEQALLEQKLKPLLTDYFVPYFRDNPSHRAEPPQVQSLPEDKQWYPNNSIQFVEYYPDLKVYGGSIGLELAQNQFEVSSKTVLRVLNDYPDPDYNTMIGLAIYLHLTFAYAVAMDMAEMRSFFEYNFKKWLPYAYGFEPSLSETEIKERQNIALNIFERNFLIQKNFLFEIHRTLLDNLNNQRQFEDEWLGFWIENNAGIVQPLIEAEKNNRIIFSDRPQSQDYHQISEEKLKLWPSYDVYVHMTNNRLDILKQDEAYVAYLIYMSLQAERKLNTTENYDNCIK